MYRCIAWHRAAQFGNLEALETLWNLAKEVELDTLFGLLLSQTTDGYTAFQLAARNNHVKALLKMWVWAEETHLNSKVLKKILRLGKDHDGYSSWHRAAQFVNLEALEILWTLAKDLELDTHEFLLFQTEEGYTAFQLAAKSNHVGIKELLLVFGRRSANES